MRPQLSWLHFASNCPGPTSLPLFHAGRQHHVVRGIPWSGEPIADPSRFFYELGFTAWWQSHCPDLPPPTYRELGRFKGLEARSSSWEIRGPLRHSFRIVDLLYSLAYLLSTLSTELDGERTRWFCAESFWVELCRAYLSDDFADALQRNLGSTIYASFLSGGDLPTGWLIRPSVVAREAHWRLREYAAEKLTPWGHRLSPHASQAWLDKVLLSDWFTAHYPRFQPIEVVPLAVGSGMWARARDGQIRGSRDWLNDFTLCHELAHFTQPAGTFAHGPEFAGTLLRLLDQFCPDSAPWLRQGHGLVSMSVSTEADLEAKLATSGTYAEQEWPAAHVFQNQVIWSSSDPIGSTHVTTAVF
jgi:hypothetical protein